MIVYENSGDDMYNNILHEMQDCLVPKIHPGMMIYYCIIDYFTVTQEDLEQKC